MIIKKTEPLENAVTEELIHTRLSLRIVYCKKSAVNFHRTLKVRLLVFYEEQE